MMLLVAIELSVEDWGKLMQIVLALLATLITAYVIPWLSRHTPPKWQGPIARLDDAVRTAVRATEQQLVSAFRKASPNGKLTPAQAAIAFAHAADLVVKQLGAQARRKMISELGMTEDTFATMTDARIEAELHDVKTSSPAVTVPALTP